MGLDRVYQQQLLEHHRNPRNYGTIENPDFYAEIVSPTCGDSITMSGRIRNNTINDIAFTGEGSVLSQGTASLLTEHVTGMSVDAVQKLDTSYIQDLIGIELGPNRMQTAALPLHVLQKGIASYVASRANSPRNR